MRVVRNYTRTGYPARARSVISMLTKVAADELRQIESDRGEYHHIAASRSVAYPTPKTAMQVLHLVSILDPTELSLKQLEPITARDFINVAIGAAASIHCEFIRAVGVTDQGRSITGRRTIGRPHCVPRDVLVAAVGEKVEAFVGMVFNAAHHPALTQRTHFAGYRIQSAVRQSRCSIPSDTLAEHSFGHDIQFLPDNRHNGA